MIFLMDAGRPEDPPFGWLPEQRTQREVLVRRFGRGFVEGQSPSFIAGAYHALISIVGDVANDLASPITARDH